MVESTSRMAKTSVPGIYRLPSGLFLVRIRMRFGSASQSFTSMSSPPAPMLNCPYFVR